MASNTDKFIKSARRWTGQIGASGVADASITTIPLVSTTNLPTDTAVQITIDRVDANGNLTPSKEEVIRGVVSGSNLIDAVRGVEGTAQAHSAGAVVEVILTSDQWDRQVDALLEEHHQDGSHKASGDGIMAIMSALNPVGTIREFNVSTNPASLLGFGTWESYGTGRVTVAIDVGQTEFDTVGETGGTKEVTLTAAQSGLPAHNHPQASNTLLTDTNISVANGSNWYKSAGIGGNTQNNAAKNASEAHTNLQPYIVVYRWVRTA